jgi:hypothetical protein
MESKMQKLVLALALVLGFASSAQATGVASQEAQARWNDQHEVSASASFPWAGMQDQTYFCRNNNPRYANQTLEVILHPSANTVEEKYNDGRVQVMPVEKVSLKPAAYEAPREINFVFYGENHSLTQSFSTPYFVNGPGWGAVCQRVD